MYPLDKDECCRLGASADFGALSCFWLGSGLPRAWRTPNLISSSTTTGGILRAACGCSSAGRLTSARLFFCGWWVVGGRRWERPWDLRALTIFGFGMKAWLLLRRATP